MIERKVKFDCTIIDGENDKKFAVIWVDKSMMYFGWTRNYK